MRTDVSAFNSPVFRLTFLADNRKDVAPKRRRFYRPDDLGKGDNLTIGMELQYRCACQADGSSCGGVVLAKIEKVKEDVTPGERVTLSVEHTRETSR